MDNNYYNVLGLPLDASHEEIREAYYEKIKYCHPDKNSSAEAKQLFFLIQEAYEALQDKSKRATYDSTLDQNGIPFLQLREIYSAPSIQLIDEEQILYYMIEVSTSKIGASPQDTPIAITFLIDRSTSMSGERLVVVKNGILRLLKKLKDEDMIGVIAFSDKAEIVIPMMSVFKARFQEQKILAIQAFGATEMLKGLESAESMMNNRDVKSYKKKIFMLTDGHTYGDEEGCQALAEKMGQKSIELFAVGFGNEWNDSFLDKLTEISGGVAEFAENTDQLTHFFHEIINKSSGFFADSIQLELITSEFAKINYCFRISPDASPLFMEPPIRLGSINDNSRLIIIFELIIKRIQTNIKNCPLFFGKLIFNTPNFEVKKMRLALNPDISVSLKQNKQAPPNSMVNAISKLTLYRMQEKARQEVRANLPKKASQRLNQLASQLLSQGEKELAINIIQESQNIQKSGFFSKDGEKRIKYGTRRLLLNSGIERDQ